MKIINMIHGNSAMVDDELFEVLNATRWHVSASGYVVHCLRGKEVRIHRVVMNASAGVEVDHKDRNRLNNQRNNLRFCNKVQNQGNRQGNRKDGFKGVSWCKRDRVFRASIGRMGKTYNLGQFKNAADAARAYNAAAIKHFGEFAWLNPV